MAGEFAGKVAVVTGGSRGIGRAIAAALAGEGAALVLAASSAANLAAAAAAIKHDGGAEPTTCAGDLRKLDACEHLYDTVSERHGRCDILVNCAGATRAGSFIDLADDAWSDGFALKLFAAVRLTRMFWPLLKAAQGHVINIIGGAARTPDPEFLIGSSVNGAFAVFSKGLSQLGKRDGINVNAIHPGATETEPHQATVGAARAGCGQDRRGNPRTDHGAQRRAQHCQAGGYCGSGGVPVLAKGAPSPGRGGGGGRRRHAGTLLKRARRLTAVPAARGVPRRRDHRGPHLRRRRPWVPTWRERRTFAYCGTTPFLPTLTRAASSVPSGFLVALRMVTWAPGLRSPRSPVA